MRKLILSLILVISFTFSYAQKSNVSKAKNKALMVENPDFAGAREAIKLALNDSTTKNQANTWFVAGLIGYKQNDALYLQAAQGKPYDKDVKGQAIMESYKYFLEAVRLDSMPDEKGKVKPKFTKEIKEKIKEYFNVPSNLISYGAYLLQDKKNYDETVNVFETYLGIPKLPFMNNEIQIVDSTYNMIMYYTAVAASNANKHDRCIYWLNQLKSKNYETKLVYQYLYEEYVGQKDTVNYVNILKEGIEKFPKEAVFLQNLINHYIYSGKTADAMVYLNTAIEREPNIAQYRFVKGRMCETMGNLDESRACFDKALELDPKLSDAYDGIGRLYYNKAVKMLEVADKIKDNKLYNAELKKINDVFKESVPFFQKASELKPNDLEVKMTLKSLYYRLKMDAEFDAISKEIEALKNNK